MLMHKTSSVASHVTGAVEFEIFSPVFFLEVYSPCWICKRTWKPCTLLVYTKHGASSKVKAVTGRKGYMCSFQADIGLLENNCKPLLCRLGAVSFGFLFLKRLKL